MRNGAFVIQLHGTHLVTVVLDEVHSALDCENIALFRGPKVLALHVWRSKPWSSYNQKAHDAAPTLMAPNVLRAAALPEGPLPPMMPPPPELQGQLVFVLCDHPQLKITHLLMDVTAAVEPEDSHHARSLSASGT